MDNEVHKQKAIRKPRRGYSRPPPDPKICNLRSNTEESSKVLRKQSVSCSSPCRDRRVPMPLVFVRMSKPLLSSDLRALPSHVSCRRFGFEDPFTRVRRGEVQQRTSTRVLERTLSGPSQETPRAFNDLAAHTFSVRVVKVVMIQEV